MGDIRMRWVPHRNGAPLVLGALAVCVLWAMARQDRVATGRLEQWAASHGDVRCAGLPSATSTPDACSPLRPRRRRAHTPPTWQQERDLARSDLHSLSREARLLVKALDKQKSARGQSAPSVVVRRRLRAALVRSTQTEARIRADLERARGFRDVLAARRKMASTAASVRQAQSCLYARHMSEHAAP